MSAPVIVSQLWPKSQQVSVELALRHGFDVAAPAGALSSGQISAIEGAGRRHIALSAETFGLDTDQTLRRAQAKFAELQSVVPGHVASIAGDSLGTKISSAILSSVAKNLGSVMFLIDALDALREREEIVGVILSESALHFGKTAALWAKNRGIASFVLSHGAGIGEAYTITGNVVADFLLLVGDRGTEPFLDRGFPRERMAVCGSPNWDDEPAVLANRSGVRRQVHESIGVDEAIPLVVFGTTWNAKLTALRDIQIHQRTLVAFLQACRILRERGVIFHAVIKDRPSNAQTGASECARLAAIAGFEGYSYVTGEMIAALAAADVFVGHDTSVFVEAMIAGVPGVAIWAPSCWLLGPALDQTDGVPYIQHTDPEALASAIAARLPAGALREVAIQSGFSSLERFVFAADGNSAQRCADAIAKCLPAPVARAVPPSIKSALWEFVETPPRLVVDLGSEPSQTSQALREKYAAHVVRITTDGLGDGQRELADADIVVLDEQLARMYDPWGFLVRLKPLLARGARVLASVPNARSFTVLAEMIQGRWEHTPNGKRDLSQLRFFTRKTLMDLFEQTGYRVVRLHAVYDPKIGLPALQPEGRFDLDVGAYALKGVSAQDVEELRTLQFLVESTPS